MTSTQWFVLSIAAVGVERVVELILSQRHVRWALERGGVGGRSWALSSHGGPARRTAGRWSLVEVLLPGRAFYPWLGWPMLLGVLSAQSLRWWCIRTLGPQWNTRVVVVPGLIA